MTRMVWSGQMGGVFTLLQYLCTRERWKISSRPNWENLSKYILSHNTEPLNGYTCIFSAILAWEANLFVLMFDYLLVDEIHLDWGQL